MVLAFSNAGYHTFCLQPPLNVVLRERWLYRVTSALPSFVPLLSFGTSGEMQALQQCSTSVVEQHLGLGLVRHMLILCDARAPLKCMEIQPC